MKVTTRRRIGKAGVLTISAAAVTFCGGAILTRAAEDLGWTWALIAVLGPLVVACMFMYFLYLWTGPE